MIKFFRKIRQNLLFDNKIAKYFTYVIGEIILVVIGILIALQINNWNQDRLNGIEEQRILTAISEELKLNTFLFERGISLQENKMAGAKNLLNEMQARKEKPDLASLDIELGRLTQRWLSGTSTSIYDALIGSGDLKLISSEKLRNELTLLKSDQEFLQLFEEIQFKFEDEKLSPFLNKYINRSSIRLLESNGKRIREIPLTPFEPSYDLLLESKEFANLLVESIEHTHRVLSNYDRLGRRVQRIDSLAKSDIVSMGKHPDLKVIE